MKNHFGFFVCLLSLLLFTGCEDEKLNANDSYNIEFGSVCGWCAGEEKITVTKTKVEYLREIPCGENTGKTELSRTFTAQEWDNLINALDYNHFLTLDYNVCNVCLDGCDEFIIITKDGESHKISYNMGTEIEGIEDFQEILHGLLSGFTENN